MHVWAHTHNISISTLCKHVAQYCTVQPTIVPGFYDTLSYREKLMVIFGSYWTAYINFKISCQMMWFFIFGFLKLDTLYCIDGMLCNINRKWNWNVNNIFDVEFMKPVSSIVFHAHIWSIYNMNMWTCTTIHAAWGKVMLCYLPSIISNPSFIFMLQMSFGGFWIVLV